MRIAVNQKQRVHNKIRQGASREIVRWRDRAEEWRYRMGFADACVGDIFLSEGVTFSSVCFSCITPHGLWLRACADRKKSTLL